MTAVPAFTRTTDSPTLEGGACVRIVFTGGAASARLRGGDPWIVHGTCAFDRAILDELADDPLNHLRLVVTHRETGAVFVGGVLGERMTPFAPISTAMEGGELTSVGAYLTVDVRQQCNVPPDLGRYWIVALVAGRTSTALVVDVW
jgi:hypothetical protein